MQSGLVEPGAHVPSADCSEPTPSATGASDPEAAVNGEEQKSEYWTQCLGCFSWTCIPLGADEVPCSNDECGLQVVRQLQARYQ